MSTDVEQVNIHDLLQAGRERQTGNRPHLQACKSRNQMKALAATFVAQPHKYSSTHAVRVRWLPGDHPGREADFYQLSQD
jgi:hypothetical protein